MGHRLSKIYTRTGDKGTTGLADGSRVEKDSLRIKTLGDVDELNSLIGAILINDIEQGGIFMGLIQNEIPLNVPNRVLA